VGHADLHSCEKGDGRILDPLVGRFNMGRASNFACPGLGFVGRSGSRILRGSAVWKWRKLRAKEV
jgi:hypothetical protein